MAKPRTPTLTLRGTLALKSTVDLAQVSAACLSIQQILAEVCEEGGTLTITTAGRITA